MLVLVWMGKFQKLVLKFLREREYTVRPRDP